MNTHLNCYVSIATHTSNLLRFKIGAYIGIFINYCRFIFQRTKLMSIKDNSAPSEDSLTAKFINLIKTQDWPEPEYRLLPRIGPNKIEVYGCTVRGSYSLDNNEVISIKSNFD